MSTGTTGATGTTLNTPAPGTTTQQGLAPWASPYITNYLGQAQALGNSPYQMYQGPLTAGASPLQTQAFQGIGSLTMPGSLQGAGNYTPVGSDFTSAAAAQYMNPYLQNALNPQLEELRRQSQITQLGNDARMTKAGAFGGSRQALMTTENQRNLLSQMDRTVGQGYSDAYDKAMGQFNADQARKIQEAQFGAELGIRGGQAELGAQRDILNSQLTAGQAQRDIESEGIAADLAEFNQQREFPYKQLQFQRDMISGLPVSSIASNPASLSGVAALLSAIGGINELSGSGSSSLNTLLNNLGLGGLLGGSSS